MIRWYRDLAISGLTVIGKVWQLAVEEDVPKGAVKPAGKWQARGMLADWCDVDLGQHSTRGEAMKAVEGSGK